MRTTSKALLLIASLAAAGGCAVKKDFYAMGGSRADGTVDMAYDFRQFEQPIVSHDQARSIAKSKCGVWGYRDAESFGGMTQNCYQRDGFGSCVAGQMIIKYQCIGNLDAQASPSPTSASQAPPAHASGSLSKAQWQQQQLQQIQNTPMSYEEYQRRYKQIMAQ
ncbi:YecR-like lipoprotein [compost metagenome]